MRVLQITGLVLLWVWTGVQVATAASCSDQVSSGDKSVGISGEYAATCPSAGGVGCFGGDVACRFCKLFNTPQSANFAACATTTTTTAAPSTSVTPTVTPTVAPTPTPTANDDCVEALTVARKMTSPRLVCMDLALRSYFSSELSVQAAEDPIQFRTQMLLHDEDDDQVENPLTVDKVLIGMSNASYVAQLAVILDTWHSTGMNPLLSSSTATEASTLTIEGVTPEFTSRQRVFDLSIDTIHSFIAEVEGEAEEDALTATTSLVDELGGARGVLTLLGFQQTVGSRNLAPLTLRQCLKAFTQRHTPKEPLTVGARAFSKHCARSSSGWWGEMKGNDAAKNLRAETKARELLATATWKNIHSLPHAHATMEIRNALGYGARWDAETGTFRGFLEPPMLNGHEIKWRH